MGYPSIQYHRECYQKFTLKSLLKRIKEKSKQQKIDEDMKQKHLEVLIDQATFDENNKPATQSSSSSSVTLQSPILLEKCIFCDKMTKYKKRKKEHLRQCTDTKAKETIERSAKEKMIFQCFH